MSKETKLLEEIGLITSRSKRLKRLTPDEKKNWLLLESIMEFENAVRTLDRKTGMYGGHPKDDNWVKAEKERKEYVKSARRMLTRIYGRRPNKNELNAVVD